MAETDMSSSTNCASVEPRAMLLLSVRDRIELFAVSALALLVSYLGQLVLAGALTAVPLRILMIALLNTSVAQDFVVLLWAALSGVLFLLGAGRLAWVRRARLIALIAGAISPWVLLGLAQFEGYFWPAFRETGGPLDRPLMTLPLLFCALLTPWLAGRAARAGAQAKGPAAASQIPPSALMASKKS